MNRRGPKNFVRRRIQDGGQTSWTLETQDGTPFPALLAFSRHIREYKYSTRKKYVEAVTKFLDYMFEAGAFGGDLTQSELRNAVNGYTTFLKVGTKEAIRRSEAPPGPDKAWLVPIARALEWPATRRASMGNSIAGINHFLTLSTALAREAKERGAMLGTDVSLIDDAKLPEFTRDAPVSGMEIAAMRQGSMLGSIVKMAPRLTRPGRLRKERGPGQEDFDGLDFPLDYVLKLADAALNWRDRAMWLLIAATGMRLSEARNVLLEDIDFLARNVYVRDPEGRRFPAKNERVRFKGRTTAETMLQPMFADAMFDAIRNYIDKLYVPCYVDGESHYLFQCVKAPYVGRPLVLVSDSTLVDSFAAAANRCGAPRHPTGRNWTSKSLRHAYGVYMLNDYPANPEAGIYGLSLPQVQLAMGHKDIRITQTYARVKRRRLVAAAQHVDQLMIAGWEPTERFRG